MVDYGVDTDYQGVVSSSGSVNDCDGYMEYSYLNIQNNVGTYKILTPFFEEFGFATIEDYLAPLKSPVFLAGVFTYRIKTVSDHY